MGESDAAHPIVELQNRRGSLQCNPPSALCSHSSGHLFNVPRRALGLSEGAPTRMEILLTSPSRQD